MARGTSVYSFLVCGGKTWDNEAAEQGDGITEGNRSPRQEEPCENGLNSPNKSSMCFAVKFFRSYEIGLKWVAYVVPSPEALVASRSESHSRFLIHSPRKQPLRPILAYIYACVFYLAIKIFLCMQSFHTHRSTLCFLYLNYQRQPFILDLSLCGKGKIVTSGWTVI